MALIPGFEYDIFISYAHVDNATISDWQIGWIRSFHDHLRQMLDRRYGRMGMVKIWWDDKELDGSKVFDDSIRSGIEKSAIFIALNSSGYQKSEYCQQELDFFYKKTQADNIGLKVAGRSRIVQVMLNNIDPKEWPEALSRTAGFSFHDAKEKEDYGDFLEPNSEVFIKQIRKLRDALWPLINDFGNELKAEEAAVEKDADAFTIYIGEVADTLRTSRKRVVSELEKKGYQVITGIPPPDEAEAHQKATEDAIQKADLSVHLLDEYPGREIVGSPEFWYPQKQTEISLQTAKPQMIWVPSDTDFSHVEEPDYQTFLKNIETGNGISKAYEFVKGSKSNLAKQITDFADQLRLKEVEMVASDEKLSVLLDTHPSDQTYAIDLGKALLANNIQTFINPQEDDPRKNIEMLGNCIGQVKKMIFLYGKVSKEWVLERMSAALQLIITRNYPVEDFMVYMAPPHKDANDININQRFLKINIVDNSNDSILDKAVLNKFLNALKSGEA